ncbi:MAG: DUF2200 domain-containing protein [Ignavibacteria bacterium]|jgi:hypothetical protein
MTADERIAAMVFASIYPLYRTKVERKGRQQTELDEVLCWLLQTDTSGLLHAIDKKWTFATLFEQHTVNPNAGLITGTICGYRVESIENPLTQKVRYMDKLVDELAKGRPLTKILRAPKEE